MSSGVRIKGSAKEGRKDVLTTSFPSHWLSQTKPMCFGSLLWTLVRLYYAEVTE